MLSQHEIQIRVRYQETDGQGRLHHANYFTYFEQGRTELLRAAGKSYREVEEAGYLLVVAEIGCEYFGAAGFDDLLTLRTVVDKVKGARIHHRYEVFRDGELLARALGRGLHRSEREAEARAGVAGAGVASEDRRQKAE